MAAPFQFGGRASAQPPFGTRIVGGGAAAFASRPLQHANARRQLTAGGGGGGGGGGAASAMHRAPPTDQQYYHAQPQYGARDGDYEDDETDDDGRRHGGFAHLSGLHRQEQERQPRARGRTLFDLGSSMAPAFDGAAAAASTTTTMSSGAPQSGPQLHGTSAFANVGAHSTRRAPVGASSSASPLYGELRRTDAGLAFSIGDMARFGSGNGAGNGGGSGADGGAPMRDANEVGPGAAFAFGAERGGGGGATSTNEGANAFLAPRPPGAFRWRDNHKPTTASHHHHRRHAAPNAFSAAFGGGGGGSTAFDRPAPNATVAAATSAAAAAAACAAAAANNTGSSSSSSLACGGASGGELRATTTTVSVCGAKCEFCSGPIIHTPETYSVCRYDSLTDELQLVTRPPDAQYYFCSFDCHARSIIDMHREIYGDDNNRDDDDDDDEDGGDDDEDGGDEDDGDDDEAYDDDDDEDDDDQAQ